MLCVHSLTSLSNLSDSLLDVLGFLLEDLSLLLLPKVILLVADLESLWLVSAMEGSWSRFGLRADLGFCLGRFPLDLVCVQQAGSCRVHLAHIC